MPEAQMLERENHSVCRNQCQHSNWTLFTAS